MFDTKTKNNEEQYGLDDELVHLLLKCGHFIHHEEYVKGGQNQIMRFLGERGNMTQRELQDIVKIKSSSLSEVLGKIESKGYITRNRSVNNKRNVDIELTENGKLVASQIKGKYAECIKEMYLCLSHDEKKMLKRLLNILIKHWYNE